MLFTENIIYIILKLYYYFYYFKTNFMKILSYSNLSWIIQKFQTFKILFSVSVIDRWHSASFFVKELWKLELNRTIYLFSVHIMFKHLKVFFFFFPAKQTFWKWKRICIDFKILKIKKEDASVILRKKCEVPIL